MISILCIVIGVLCACLWFCKDSPAVRREQAEIEQWFSAYMAHISQGSHWREAVTAADEMLKRVRALSA